ncbi:MAG: DUF433 domain-containing protein [Anaerolineae bacterium]
MSTTVEAQQVYDELAWLRQAVETLTQQVEGLVADQKKPMLSTTHAHIARVQGVKGGEPIIRGKGVTVQTIVVLTQRGLTPEQIVEEYEGILTLAEVHDALGYYYDHPGEIEQYVAENQAALERAWPSNSY